MAYDFAPAVILGIDASKACSGSTLLVPHLEPKPGVLKGRGTEDKPSRIVRTYTLEHFCEVKTQADHENCVMHLIDRARELDLPPVVVAETWVPHGKWGPKQYLGMGEGWGWWTAEMRRAVERFPDIGVIHVERVVPTVWRADLFGGKLLDENLKLAAIQYVKARLQIRVPSDVAEAVCVALWGAQNDSVHAGVEKWHVKQSKLRQKLAKAASAKSA